MENGDVDPSHFVGLEQAEAFVGDDGRGKNDGKREAEFLELLAGEAQDEAGGYGGTGSGEAAERKAEALDDADNAALR